MLTCWMVVDAPMSAFDLRKALSSPETPQLHRHAFLKQLAMGTDRQMVTAGHVLLAAQRLLDEEELRARLFASDVL